MSAHQFRFSAHGYTGRVHLDGQDISHVVRDVTVKMRAGDVPQVTLDLALLGLDDSDLDLAEVHMSAPTRDLLTRLGWTPPEPSADCAYCDDGDKAGSGRYPCACKAPCWNPDCPRRKQAHADEEHQHVPGGGTRTTAAGEPRLSEAEIQGILSDLGIIDTVSEINATDPTATPSDRPRYAMIFLSDQATPDTVTTLTDALNERGWATSVNRHGTKIHVSDRGCQTRALTSPARP